MVFACSTSCVGMARRWFTRYSGWGPGQLQRECASGVWFTAAASSAFILQQGAQDRGPSGRDMWHQVNGQPRSGCVALSGQRFGVYASPVQEAREHMPPDALLETLPTFAVDTGKTETEHAEGSCGSTGQ